MIREDDFDSTGAARAQEVDIWFANIEEHVDTQAVCRKCGGTAFKVFGGNYLAVAACVTCDVPFVAHVG